MHAIYLQLRSRRCIIRSTFHLTLQTPCRLSHSMSRLRAQFIYGFGVGGEYPLASSSAAERAEADAATRARRGETIVCTFAMQARAPFESSNHSSEFR